MAPAIQLRSVTAYIHRHALAATLLFGSLITCAWALLRFFTYPSTFDLVGQQLLARQLVHGGIQGAVVGPTNYIIKIFGLYIPFDWLHISPRLSLVLMTLLTYTATFVLITLVLRLILLELQVAINGYFYLGMLWFACLSSSIFWIQFTNFRNLEVAGGLYLIYLGLRLQRLATWRLGVWIAVFSALLFFADPLQVYMTALPLLVFVLLRNRNWKRWVCLAAVLLAGVVGGKLLVSLVQHALGIIFITSAPISSGVHSILQQPLPALRGFVASNLRLFAGGPDMGHWRQVVDIVILVILLGYWLWLVWRRQVKSQLVLFVGTLAVIIEVVYLLSGQSLQGDTSRYLIMLAPLMVLVLASYKPSATQSRWLRGYIVVAVVATALLLGGTLAAKWDGSFSKDAHLAATASHVDTIGYDYAVTSMDTAIPVTYYYSPKTPLLPVACHNGRLERQTLYYSGRAYSKALRAGTGFAAIVMDGSAIRTYPYSCDEPSVIAQFGQPSYQGHSSDGSTELIYPSQKVGSLL